MVKIVVIWFLLSLIDSAFAEDCTFWNVFYFCKDYFIIIALLINQRQLLVLKSSKKIYLVAICTLSLRIVCELLFLFGFELLNNNDYFVYLYLLATLLILILIKYDGKR